MLFFFNNHVWRLMPHVPIWTQCSCCFHFSDSWRARRGEASGSERVCVCARRRRARDGGRRGGSRFYSLSWVWWQARGKSSVKGAVWCKNNESVQGLHVGYCSTNHFKSPVREQVMVEVKTWELPRLFWADCSYIWVGSDFAVKKERSDRGWAWAWIIKKMCTMFNYD